MGKYTSVTALVLFGLLLPLSIFMVTTVTILTESQWLFGYDQWGVKFMFIVALIIMNLWAIFSLWLTYRSCPVKIAYERIPCIGIGIVYNMGGNKTPINFGILLPFIAIGLEFKKESVK